NSGIRTRGMQEGLPGYNPRHRRTALQVRPDPIKGGNRGEGTNLYPNRMTGDRRKSCVREPAAAACVKICGMSRPLEEIIREADLAFSRGDIDGYVRACSSDFTFDIPGTGGISGSWPGKQGIQDLAQRAMALSDGTFHEEVEDVLANDRHAIVLAR